MLAFRRFALVFVLSGLVLPLFGLSAGTIENEINAIKVIPGEGSLRLEISKVGDINFDTFTMSSPDRLVVDCVGAKYDLRWSEKELEHSLVRRIRTSQFQVDPVLISRIVLDLRKKVDYRNFDDGDIYVLEITERNIGTTIGATGEPLKSSSTTDPSATAKDVDKDTGILGTGIDHNRGSINPAAMGPVLPLITPGKDQEADATKVAPPTEKLESEEIRTEVVENPWLQTAEQKSKKTQASVLKKAVGNTGTDASSPIGIPAVSEAEELPWAEPYMRGNPAVGGGFGMGSRRITLDAQGANIKTVLRTIADFAGINIVAGSDVKGEVYVHIKDAPWEEALDILLKAHGYGYREEYGMIRVAEMNRLMKEELDQQTTERKKDELLPLVTRIIFINNSNAEEIKSALRNVASSRGQIDVDLGSNAIIINDIERNVEKISEMIAELDKKNFQVDINAKLVEVDVEATRELGINWGLLNLHKSGFSGMGSAEVNENISVASGTLKFGTVRSWGELNSMLELLEKSNKANIISNPRITTMDNREASILVGKEIPLIVADEAGNPITELTKIGIMLKVIPHVNADRTVTLDLHPEVSELQSESTAQGGVIIATSEADTRVIVRDGETAVIGGLIKKVDTDVKRGIPFLKDVPYLGALFSSTNTASKKQELVIFVTPTIVE